MRILVVVIALAWSAVAVALPHSASECREGGDFIRNAALARDAGYTREFFVGRLEEDFVKQASVLSPTAKRDREEAFRRRMQEYQQKVTELKREVQEKQKDVMEGFREKIETVAGKVAKRLGLQIVVDGSKGGATLYREDTLDISNQVIEEFNRDYP